MRPSFCSEQVKLLREGRLGIAGVVRLLLAHHVHHFNSAQDGASAVYGLESEHRPDPPFDSPMILLSPIVHATTLVDTYRLQLPS